MHVRRMNAAWLPQDIPLHLVRFTMDQINTSSHHMCIYIYTTRLDVRTHAHVQAHAYIHIILCTLVEIISLALFVPLS
jgi:hypothetical protein